MNVSKFTMNDQTHLHSIHVAPENQLNYPPILLVHGYGEHIGRYRHVIDALVQEGFTVWGYDARGHGLSDGAQGFIDQDDRLITDLTHVFSQITQSSGIAPIVVAHSMGGLVSALAVCHQKIKPSALVLSSPLMRARMTWFQKGLLKVGLKLFKDRPLDTPAVSPSAVSRDPHIVAQYISDPLIHSMISPRMAESLRTGGQFVLSQIQHFTMPTLLIYAGLDKVADPEGSHDLAKKLPKHAEVVCYPEAYHEIFNEPIPERDQIIQHMIDWIKSHHIQSTS